MALRGEIHVIDEEKADCDQARAATCAFFRFVFGEKCHDFTTPSGTGMCAIAFSANTPIGMGDAAA